MAYTRYDAQQTLPAKFERILRSGGLGARVKDKSVAIKIHAGGNLNYSTVPPLFLRIAADFVREAGGRPFFCDHYLHWRNPERRGYTEEALGAPVLEICGYLGKYYYEKPVQLHSFRHCDVAGLINDVDFLIDFSHVKGHGCCGYGGACKNIAMGCVTDRTRGEIHSLEGGITWDGSKCTHCGACLGACNHFANGFDAEGKYEYNMHHCTLCQHCIKVCPTGALTLSESNYSRFQQGMALCTKTVLDTFGPGNVYYINLLTQITALCDCWGMTTPSLVPDLGLLASDDIVAIEQASLDLIKFEDLIPAGVPQGMELGASGHLFERLHGKDPYLQVQYLQEQGLGSREYTLEAAE